MPDSIDRRGLVEENLGLAYWWVGRVSRSCPRRVDPDDLLSAAFLGIARAARSWDPNRGNFASYAVASIRRAVACQRAESTTGITLAEWHKRKRLGLSLDDARRVPFPDHFDPAEPEGNETVDADRAEWMAAALAKLEPAESALLLCRFWSGLEYQQIADRFGRGPEAIRQRVERILWKLKPIIETLR